MFFASIIIFLGGVFADFVDNIITGNFINEQAISAIGLINPFFTLISFLSCISVSGTLTLYIKSISKNEKNKSKIIIGTTLIMCVALGLFMFLMFMVFHNLILDYMCGNNELYVYANTYLSYLRYFGLITPLLYFIEDFIYIINGREKLGSVTFFMGRRQTINNF